MAVSFNRSSSDPGLSGVMSWSNWKEGTCSQRGFCYLISQLIQLPLRNVGGELLHAVAITTVSKFISVGENRPRCQEGEGVNRQEQGLFKMLEITEERPGWAGNSVRLWASGAMLRVGYHSYVYRLPCETQVQPEPSEMRFTFIPEAHHQCVHLCMTGGGRKWCPIRVKGGPKGIAACRERTEPHAHYCPQTSITGRPPAPACR